MNGKQLKEAMMALDISNGAMANCLSTEKKSVSPWTVTQWRGDHMEIPEAMSEKICKMLKKNKIHFGWMGGDQGEDEPETLPFEPEETVPVPALDIPMMKDVPKKNEPKRLQLTELTMRKMDALALLTGMERESIIVDIIERNIDAYIGTKVRREE